jgi:hypothetical protein
VTDIHRNAATTPPLVRQINDGNWLAQEEAESLRAELFYQRAIHAHDDAARAERDRNARRLRESVRARLPRAADLEEADGQPDLVPTPNADVIYAMSYLDLKEPVRS